MHIHPPSSSSTPSSSHPATQKYTLTPQEIAIGKQALLHLQPQNTRLVAFYDTQGALHLESNLKAKTATQYPQNNPDLLVAVIGELFQSNCTHFDQMEKSEKTLEATMLHQEEVQLLENLNSIIASYQEEEGDNPLLSQLHSLYTQYQQQIYAHGSKLQASAEQPQAPDVSRVKIHVGYGPEKVQPVRGPLVRSIANTRMDPKPTVVGLKNIRSRNFTSHLIESPLRKAAYVLAKTGKQEFPLFYGPFCVTAETQALQKVEAFNPRDKGQIAAWTTFYAKLCVIDAEPDSSKLQNLFKNRDFLTLLEKGARFFGQLSNSMTDFPPITKAINQDAKAIAEVFKNVYHKASLQNSPYNHLFSQELRALENPSLSEEQKNSAWKGFHNKLLLITETPNMMELRVLFENQQFVHFLKQGMELSTPPESKAFTQVFNLYVQFVDQKIEESGFFINMDSTNIQGHIHSQNGPVTELSIKETASLLKEIRKLLEMNQTEYDAANTFFRGKGEIETASYLNTHGLRFNTNLTEKLLPTINRELQTILAQLAETPNRPALLNILNEIAHDAEKTEESCLATTPAKNTLHELTEHLNNALKMDAAFIEIVKCWHTEHDVSQGRAEREAFVISTDEPPIQAPLQLSKDIHREAPIIQGKQILQISGLTAEEEDLLPEEEKRAKQTVIDQARQARTETIFDEIRILFNDPRLSNERIGEIATLLCCQTPIINIMDFINKEYCLDHEGNMIKLFSEDKNTPRIRSIDFDPKTNQIVFTTEATFNIVPFDDIEGAALSKLTFKLVFRIGKETLLNKSMEHLNPEEIDIQYQIINE